MGKDLYEEVLGPEAPTILREAARRHPELVGSLETEAVELYGSEPQSLTEAHRTALCGLLTAIADDFGSRRRAVLLAELASRTAPSPVEDDDEEWIPDEDGFRVPMGDTRTDIPPDGDLEALLDELSED